MGLRPLWILGEGTGTCSLKPVRYEIERGPPAPVTPQLILFEIWYFMFHCYYHYCQVTLSGHIISGPLQCSGVMNWRP